MDAALQADLDPLRERLETLQHAVQASIEALTIDVPERPEPISSPPSENVWLFDASRDYINQLVATSTAARTA